MNLKRSPYLIACAGIFAVEMTAQPQSWNNVQALSPGTEIRITGPHAGVIRGTLQRVTDDSVVLSSSAGQEMFARRQVTRISVKEKGHRGRNVLIGLGVGAGAGLLLGAVGDHNCGSNLNCNVPGNFGKTYLPPLFGAVGALVGAVMPTGGWRDIYKL